MANNLLPTGLSFQRLDSFPIDSTYSYETLAECMDYVNNNPTKYLGQLLYVKDARPNTSVGDPYDGLFIIDRDGVLKSVKSGADINIDDIKTQLDALELEVGNPLVKATYVLDNATGTLTVVADDTDPFDPLTQVKESDVVGIATIGDKVNIDTPAVDASGLYKIIEDKVKDIDFSTLQTKEDDTLTTDDKTIVGAINELDLEIGVKEVVGIPAHYEASIDINALTVVADGTLVNGDTEVEESTVNADGSTFQVGDKVVLIPEVLATPSTGLYKEIDDSKESVINDYLGGKKLIYLTQAEYDLLSDAEKNDDTKVYNITDAENEADAIITEEITVKGTHCGALEDGDVIPKDTTLTDLVKMLTQKVILPEYVEPTLKLSITPATLKQEVGTVITPVLSYTFTQNDAGVETSHTYSPVDSETQAQLTIVEGNNIEYSVTVNYDEGSQKQDNFGNLNGTPIQAGSLTDKVKYTGIRYMFYGINTTNNTYADSDSIRGLANKREVGNVTITVPTGSRQIVIAVPSGKTMTSALYEEQGNADYKDNFILSNVDVSGYTSGQDIISYNVYIYDFAIPNSSKMTFKVSIA